MTRTHLSLILVLVLSVAADRPPADARTPQLRSPAMQQGSESGDDERARLTLELEQTLRQIADLRSRTRRDEENFDREISESRRRREELSTRLAAIKTQGTAARKEPGRELEPDRLAARIESLERRVESGLEIDRDQKRAAISRMKSDLEVEDHDAIARGLLDFYADDLRDARQRGLASRFVEVAPGTEQPAWCLRLGLAASWFVTESREFAGIDGVGGEGFRVTKDEEDQRSIELALEVARRRKPAQWVLMPFGAKAP